MRISLGFYKSLDKHVRQRAQGGLLSVLAYLIARAVNVHAILE